MEELLKKLEDVREHIYHCRVGELWKEPYAAVGDAIEELKTMQRTIEVIPEKLRKADSKGFMGGVAWAAALHGEFGECNTEEFITEAGYSWEDLVEGGVDEYDLRRIARALGQDGIRGIRRDKK